jgi:rfaE bifunctional protein nucleotidyltransferase chain/domain
MRNAADKIVPFEKSAALAASLKKSGKTLISTNGCFDLLHLGHLQYLASARALGDLLWIGLNSDASVKRSKGPSRPLQDEKVRALQLAALEAVDYVTVFGEDTPENWLAGLAPSIHVKGGDYRPEDLPEAKVVQAAGGKVLCLAFTPGYSTTDLIERIKTSSR